MEPSAMSTFLAMLGDIVTQMLDWAIEVCVTIVSNPFLLFTVGILAAGAAIGIVRRLLSRG